MCKVQVYCILYGMIDALLLLSRIKQWFPTFLNNLFERKIVTLSSFKAIIET